MAEHYYACVCATIREALAGYDAMTLAHWWALLNRWEWPADFPVAEPLGWRTARTYVGTQDQDLPPWTPSKYLLQQPMTEVLRSLVTEEEFLHAAWVHDGFSTDEFYAWWDARGDEQERLAAQHVARRLATKTEET